MAAGTVTITEETYGVVKKLNISWTAGTDAQAGIASGATTLPYNGEVVRLVTVPGTGGDAPDDNYGVTLKDEDGCDVLMGAGAARDTAVTEQVLASSLGVVANDKLTFAVTGAGSANKGTAYVYIR